MTSTPHTQVCDDFRTRIAIGESDHDDVIDHLVDCPACSEYAAQNILIDQRARGLFTYTAPAELTTALLTIAADHANPLPSRRQPWWSTLLAFGIGVVALVSTIIIAAQLVVLFAGPYGFGVYAADVVAAPQRLYQWLVAVLPLTKSAFETWDTIRGQLLAILVGALAWFAYSNRQTRRRAR
ncbi:MAG: hypothetical protein RLZZ297_1971 [Chloroflexota bacterium]|jgi:hypothetical protein